MKQSDLSGFIGTENYYKYGKILLTDGVKYLAETAKCYWLLDIVASAQITPKIHQYLKEDDFQSIKLVVKNKKAVFTIDDGNKNILYTQNIKYTDFPLDEIKLYLINNVLMLTSEY